MRVIFYSLISLFLFIRCGEDINKNDRSLMSVDNIVVKNSDVYYYVENLKTPFNVLFLSDTHFTVEDERGQEFYLYTQRMGGDFVNPENYGITNGREKSLMASLEKAKNSEADLVVLGGDIVNFPSLASVEYIYELLNNSGMNWMYIAGNHDWHYEGEPGFAFIQREKWTQSNLKPLYQGFNTMFRSQIIHNINFVVIDNSTFEITEEQLAFFKEQINKGLPIVLFLHIPLYLFGHDIDYGCGSPDWNQQNDCYYKIERREPWPKDGGSETTFQFRNLVFNSQEVIGIYAGHVHQEAVDFFSNKIQYVSAANYDNKDVLIHFMKAE